jgi:tRNA G26 N,N-dimethylase Trm1
MALRRPLESIVRRFRMETCFQYIKVQLAMFDVKVQPAMSYTKKHSWVRCYVGSDRARRNADLAPDTWHQ